jgi:hypothetical protein
MRDTFLQPIPELELAADFLDQAADAVVARNFDVARSLLIEADMSTLREYEQKITGAITLGVHWQEALPSRSLLSENHEKRRMPTVREERIIAVRDGWRCRFCNSRVISKKARNFLNNLFPNEARWARRNSEKHCALSAPTASLDHILPHSRGGNNDQHNLVTACGPCQFGRNQWTLEEVGFNDPRERAPIKDRWDGLTRLLASGANST